MGFCNASRSHGFCSTSKRWYKGINISAKTTRHTTHVASQRAHGVSDKESSVLHSGKETYNVLEMIQSWSQGSLLRNKEKHTSKV